MTVSVLPASVLIRAFEVVYVPNLDEPDAHLIRLGLVGELRMGERYANGLIARSVVPETDLHSVGDLGRRLLERPFEFLQKEHRKIWEAREPSVAFARAISRTHSSLQFNGREPVVEKAPPPVHAAAAGTAEDERTWCKEYLRLYLRSLFLSWIGVEPNRIGEQAAPLEESKAA